MEPNPKNIFPNEEDYPIIVETSGRYKLLRDLRFRNGLYMETWVIEHSYGTGFAWKVLESPYEKFVRLKWGEMKKD